MIEIVLSVNLVPIRFGAERWLHISLGHSEMVDYYDDMLQTLATPELVYAGKNGELLAVRSLADDSDKKLVVVYKETSATDGFVITAYLTRKMREFQKRTLLWPLQN